jgi:hypothetical protein
MGEARVVCGFCKVEPKSLAYGNGERELICLKCGQRETPDAAIEIASKYAAAKRPLRNGSRWQFNRQTG